MTEIMAEVNTTELLARHVSITLVYIVSLSGFRFGGGGLGVRSSLSNPAPVFRWARLCGAVEWKSKT